MSKAWLITGASSGPGRLMAECGDYPARISDPARGDHRHIDGVDNLRDERERARQ